MRYWHPPSPDLAQDGNDALRHRFYHISAGKYLHPRVAVVEQRGKCGPVGVDGVQRFDDRVHQIHNFSLCFRISEFVMRGRRQLGTECEALEKRCCAFCLRELDVILRYANREGYRVRSDVERHKVGSAAIRTASCLNRLARALSIHH